MGENQTIINWKDLIDNQLNRQYNDGLNTIINNSVYMWTLIKE